MHFCAPKSNIPLGQSKQFLEKFTVYGVSNGHVVRLYWVDVLNNSILYWSWVVDP